MTMINFNIFNNCGSVESLIVRHQLYFEKWVLEATITPVNPIQYKVAINSKSSMFKKLLILFFKYTDKY